MRRYIGRYLFCNVVVYHKGNIKAFVLGSLRSSISMENLTHLLKYGILYHSFHRSQDYSCLPSAATDCEFFLKAKIKDYIKTSAGYLGTT